MGGLKINADAEILDTQGNVIPGLYAAGETTGGTQSAGPYELRLPIFLQPLGGALKNRSAAPASPPCFRRRRTGCGTQHPLRLACVSLAAAPTTPRCFRRWRRSSSLQSAPLLFESTRESETSVFYKTKSPEYFRTLSFLGGRGWITRIYADGFTQTGADVHVGLALGQGWCTLAYASAWHYVTQSPQGRNAARVSGLWWVRGGFSYPLISAHCSVLHVS